MARSFRRSALVGLVMIIGLAGVGRAHTPEVAGGVTIDSEVFEGWLDDDEVVSHDLWLPRNALVHVAGRCDRDCSDLDLSLSNRFGTLVEDDAVDSFPVFSYRVRNSGTYRLDITMYACRVEPCHYRVAVAY
jgi:hypothetical protein